MAIQFLKVRVSIIASKQKSARLITERAIGQCLISNEKKKKSNNNNNLRAFSIPNVRFEEKKKKIHRIFKHLSYVTIIFINSRIFK